MCHPGVACSSLSTRNTVEIDRLLSLSRTDSRRTRAVRAHDTRRRTRNLCRKTTPQTAREGQRESCVCVRVAISRGLVGHVCLCVSREIAARPGASGARARARSRRRGPRATALETDFVCCTHKRYYHGSWRARKTIPRVVSMYTVHLHAHAGAAVYYMQKTETITVAIA